MSEFEDLFKIKITRVQKVRGLLRKYRQENDWQAFGAAMKIIDKLTTQEYNELVSNPV